MPIYRISITTMTLKMFIEFRDVPGIDLELYYTAMLRNARLYFGSSLATFDVMQVSDQAPVSLRMRRDGLSVLKIPCAAADKQRFDAFLNN